MWKISIAIFFYLLGSITTLPAQDKESFDKEMQRLKEQSDSMLQEQFMLHRASIKALGEPPLDNNTGIDEYKQKEAMLAMAELLREDPVEKKRLNNIRWIGIAVFVFAAIVLLVMRKRIPLKKRNSP